MIILKILMYLNEFENFVAWFNDDKISYTSEIKYSKRQLFKQYKLTTIIEGE